MHLVRQQRRNPASGKIETYYSLAWRENGRGSPQRKMSLGFIPEALATEALEKEKARRVLGLAAVPPTTSPPRSAAPPATLADLWGAVEAPWPTWPACRMLDYYTARAVRPKTLRAADSARRWIVRLLGATAVRDVSPATLDRFVLDLRQAGLKSKSIENYLVCLGTSLRVAAEEGLRGPAPRLPRLAHDDVEEPVYLSTDEVLRLYDELDAHPSPASLLIRLTETLFTRSGESMHARWEHLRRDASGLATALHIRPVGLPDGTRWAPKTGSRVVAIPPELGRRLRDEWLRQGQPGAGWIFPQEGDDRWPVTDFRKALDGACRRAGLPRMHPHALRHTGASRYAAAGATVAELMAAGGWSSPDVPMRIYTHAHPEAQASVASRAEARATPPVLHSPKTETPASKSRR